LQPPADSSTRITEQVVGVSENSKNSSESNAFPTSPNPFKKESESESEAFEREKNAFKFEYQYDSSNVADSLTLMEKAYEELLIPSEKLLEINRQLFSYHGIEFSAYEFKYGQPPKYRELNKNFVVYYRNSSEVQEAILNHNFVLDELMEKEERTRKRKRVAIQKNDYDLEQNYFQPKLRRERYQTRFILQFIPPKFIDVLHANKYHVLHVHTIVKFFSTVQQVKFFVEQNLENSHINWHLINKCLKASGNIRPDEKDYLSSLDLYPVIDLVKCY